MGSTDAFHIPYPEPADIPNIPADMRSLAEKVDDSLENTLKVVPNAAGRPTQASGRLAYQEDDRSLLVSDGTVWTSVNNPTGTVIMHAGSAAPAGYLTCNGAAVSRTAYAALFSVIGTTFGAGNGSTTFNLPNFDGKFPTGNTVGASGGEAMHTLTEAEMPMHGHATADHSHPQVVTNPLGGQPYGRADFNSDANVGAYAQGVNTGGSGVGIYGTGGSQPHNNIPPYVGLRFLIKS